MLRRHSKTSKVVPPVPADDYRKSFKVAFDRAAHGVQRMETPNYARNRSVRALADVNPPFRHIVARLMQIPRGLAPLLSFAYLCGENGGKG